FIIHYVSFFFLFPSAPLYRVLHSFPTRRSSDLYHAFRRRNDSFHVLNGSVAPHFYRNNVRIFSKCSCISTESSKNPLPIDYGCDGSNEIFTASHPDENVESKRTKKEEKGFEKEYERNQ